MKRSDELPVYETEIQQIWAEQDFEKHGMQTPGGLFPGRYGVWMIEQKPRIPQEMLDHVAEQRM